MIAVRMRLFADGSSAVGIPYLMEMKLVSTEGIKAEAVVHMWELSPQSWIDGLRQVADVIEDAVKAADPISEFVVVQSIRESTDPD